MFFFFTWFCAVVSTDDLECRDQRERYYRLNTIYKENEGEVLLHLWLSEILFIRSEDEAFFRNICGKKIYVSQLRACPLSPRLPPSLSQWGQEKREEKLKRKTKNGSQRCVCVCVRVCEYSPDILQILLPASPPQTLLSLTRPPPTQTLA